MASRVHYLLCETHAAASRARLLRLIVVLSLAGVSLLPLNGAAARPQPIPDQAPQSVGSVAATPPAHTLSIKPASVMVLPGQPQRLRLLDEKGNDVRNATWTVSNPDLAEIRREDGTWITGLKPGKVTVIATCNGQSAEAKVTVLGGVASSQAGLASEPQADRIGAGQSSSSEDSSPIYLTPDVLGMLVGQVSPIRAIGENGKPVKGAVWSVDAPGLGKITPGDDATVEALSPGDFTVTATWNGFSAEAEVTVYPGTQIPMGNVKWSVHPRPGYTKTQIVPAVPSSSGADVLELEQDKCGRSLTRAFDTKGRQVWIVPGGSGRGGAGGPGAPSTENCTGSPPPMQVIPLFPTGGRPRSAIDSGLANAHPLQVNPGIGLLCPLEGFSLASGWSFPHCPLVGSRPVLSSRA